MHIFKIYLKKNRSIYKIYVTTEFNSVNTIFVNQLRFFFELMAYHCRGRCLYAVPMVWNIVFAILGCCVLTIVNSTKIIYCFVKRHILSVMKMLAMWKCVYWLQIVWKCHEMCEWYGHKSVVVWWLCEEFWKCAKWSDERLLATGKNCKTWLLDY